MDQKIQLLKEFKEANPTIILPDNFFENYIYKDIFNLKTLNECNLVIKEKMILYREKLIEKLNEINNKKKELTEKIIEQKKELGEELIKKLDEINVNINNNSQTDYSSWLNDSFNWALQNKTLITLIGLGLTIGIIILILT